MKKIKAFLEDGPREVWKWMPLLMGMPVVHQATALRSRPWMTWGLTALCIVIFCLTFRDVSSYARAYGLIPAEAWRLGGLTFITSFFLHGGIWHLVGNLYFLMTFGPHVEEYLGNRRYLFFILAATMAGDLVHCAFVPGASTPLIGASGGISGIITYYALRFPNVRVGILLFYRWVPIPVGVALVLWLVVQFLGAYYQISGMSNVSALAHLGGATVGLLTWLVSMFGRETRGRLLEDV